MKNITLTKGYVAIVDDIDHEGLCQTKWHVDRHGGTVCAARSINVNGRWTTERMHKVIMQTPDGLDTDHINGDGLDNRRENLRICTRSENMANQKRPPSLTKTSVYKGVSYNNLDRNWRARIQVKRQEISLGSHTTEQGAAEAYDAAARQYFGEFASLNL